jgi:carboxylate-amine ligase
VARVASTWGAILVSVGTPPFCVPGLAALTDDVRYRLLRERFPEAAADVVTCGCHVHVGVPTRDLGVEVLNRLRAWLPLLLALSCNSPMWRGGDSRQESFRRQLVTRWPSATVPPRLDDAEAYDDALAERIAVGEAVDAAGVYWFARLSPRYPTVEIRIADTGLTVADTMLHAALCRALVATALDEAVARIPAAPASEPLLAASLVNAGRYGLDALVVDPRTGALARGRAVLDHLVEHVGPALLSAGDRSAVSALLAQRQRQGSGAARQRVLRKRLDRTAFVAALAAACLHDPFGRMRRRPTPSKAPQVPAQRAPTDLDAS